MQIVSFRYLVNLYRTLLQNERRTMDVGNATFTSVPAARPRRGRPGGAGEGEHGVYRWRCQLSAPLTAGRERRCRRTADRVVALSEHGEPARSADRPLSARAHQIWSM